MNYFKVINRFWDEAPNRDGYKTDHSALFFAIVDSINRNGWRDTEIEYDRIINKVRLGKKNYLEGRKWLVTHRFITLKPGQGDYAKARFGLGNAVSGRTAPDTAFDTAEPENAVSGRTASDTASGTAPDTHLIEEHITSNYLPTTQQRQHAPDGAVDGDGESAVVGISSQQEPAQNPTPNPLPTAGEVRAELLKSGPHRRYAMQQLKLARTDADYAELIEIYITQQECNVEEEQAPFRKMSDTRKHFQFWLNKRTEINYATHQTTAQSGPTRANHRGGRTKDALRSTAIGQPDYRGEGSHCDVDL